MATPNNRRWDTCPDRWESKGLLSVNKRVAIVASGSSNGAYLIEQTLVGEIQHPRFSEIWALNHQCLWIKHDLGFIIDDSSMFENDCQLLFEYMSSEDAKPFLTCQTNVHPQAVTYPIDDVVKALNDDLLTPAMSDHSKIVLVSLFSVIAKAPFTICSIERCLYPA